MNNIFIVYTKRKMDFLQYIDVNQLDVDKIQWEEKQIEMIKVLNESLDKNPKDIIPEILDKYYLSMREHEQLGFNTFEFSIRLSRFITLIHCIKKYYYKNNKWKKIVDWALKYNEKDECNCDHEVCCQCDSGCPCGQGSDDIYLVKRRIQNENGDYEIIEY